jgi:hypothetical protein
VSLFKKKTKHRTIPFLPYYFCIFLFFNVQTTITIQTQRVKHCWGRISLMSASSLGTMQCLKPVPIHCPQSNSARFLFRFGSISVVSWSKSLHLCCSLVPQRLAGAQPYPYSLHPKQPPPRSLPTCCSSLSIQTVSIWVNLGKEARLC